MTMDLYTHVLGNRKQEDMEKFETFLDANLGDSDEQINERFGKSSNPKNQVVRLFNVG